MFHDATKRWFDDNFRAPTEVQTRGWESIADNRHALLVAPTPDKFRSDFLLLLYLADRLPVDFVLQAVDERISEYESRLEGMKHCAECLEHPGHRFVHGFAESLYRAALGYLRENRDRFSAELVEMKDKQAATGAQRGERAPAPDAPPALLAGE